MAELRWASVYGRPPTLNDNIVPRSIDAVPSTDEEGDGALWPADQAHKLFAADLEALGMRVRRRHDLRRTFITLAQEDGARRDVLQVITHAPDAADVMSLYTTYPWSTLCAEVAKLQITLPERHTSRVVPAPGDSHARRPTAVQERGPQQQIAALLNPERGDGQLDARFTTRLDDESRRIREPAQAHDQASLTAGRPPVLAGVIGGATLSDMRPMELGAADAPAETNGAPRSLGEGTVAVREGV